MKQAMIKFVDPTCPKHRKKVLSILSASVIFVWVASISTLTIDIIGNDSGIKLALDSLWALLAFLCHTALLDLACLDGKITGAEEAREIVNKAAELVRLCNESQKQSEDKDITS